MVGRKNEWARRKRGLGYMLIRGQITVAEKRAGDLVVRDVQMVESGALQAVDYSGVRISTSGPAMSACERLIDAKHRLAAAAAHVGAQHYRVLMLMAVQEKTTDEAWEAWERGANDNGRRVPRPSKRRMGAEFRAALGELVDLWGLDRDVAA